ncbi:MAG: ABC transporter permease [Acidimicrobiales bacterium]
MSETLITDVVDDAENPESPLDEPQLIQPKKPRRLTPIDILGPLAIFGIFIAAWYWLSYDGMSENKAFLVPPPHEVIQESFLVWDNLWEMLQALWVTAQIALIGLGIAIVLGMSLAIFMSQARWVERSVFPYAVALQSIPILALVPLIGILFEYGRNARILVCVIIALFPIINNTLFGLQSVDQGHHDLFTLHHANRWTRLWKLQMPTASPAIFAGFRIAAGLSVIGAIVGDFFFRRGDKGIGILIDQYSARTTTIPLLYGATILAALLGYAVFSGFGLIRRVAIGRWHETTESPG